MEMEPMELAAGAFSSYRTMEGRTKVREGIARFERRARLAAVMSDVGGQRALGKEENLCRLTSFFARRTVNRLAEREGFGVLLRPLSDPLASRASHPLQAPVKLYQLSLPLLRLALPFDVHFGPSSRHHLRDLDPLNSDRPEPCSRLESINILRINALELLALV